jgi:hypothetical protein
MRIASLRHRQPSQAIALAAVAMIAVVGAVAFVIDIGFFLEGRRELQLTADQAAEAGVIFLPACPDSATCPAVPNTHDTAVQYLKNNGPIARQLCGAPLLSADFTQNIRTSNSAPVPPSPSVDIIPGVYTPDSSQPQNFYYTLTVTIRCSPGFSLGRMIMGHSTEPIAATATSVVGAIGSNACESPLTVAALPDAPFGIADNNYGYLKGVWNTAYNSGTGSTNSVITVPAANWTANNQVAGGTITFTSGANKGLSSPIASSTKTPGATVTVASAFPAAPAANDDFTVTMNALQYTVGAGSSSTVINAPTGTVWLPDQFADPTGNGFFDTITFTSGVDIGQFAYIKKNDATTITVPNGSFTSAPATGDTYVLTRQLTLFPTNSQYVGNPSISGGCVGCSGFMEVCLNTLQCGGSSLVPYFAGQTCVSLSALVGYTIGEDPGNTNGAIASGLQQRGYLSSGGTSVQCPQKLTDLVDPLSWIVVNNASPCLIQVAIIRYTDVFNNQCGRCSFGVVVDGFATIFLQSFDNNTGTFSGVYVKSTAPGAVLSYRNNATLATRLIR